MEEYQPQIYSSQHYQPSRKQAQSQQHAYDDDLEDAPLEEETKVVPMQGKGRSLDSLAEEALTPRSPKRKTSSSSQSKAKSASSKQKASKSLRSMPAVSHQPFADELRRLEAQADRINQILAERARKKDWQQSQTMAELSDLSGRQGSLEQRQGVFSASGQEYSAPAPLEQEETENLKLHAQRIKQRLAELELQMDAASSAPAATPPPTPRPSTSPRTTPPAQAWNPQSWDQRMNPRQQQQAEQDAWDTATDLRYLNHPDPTHAYGSEGLPGMEKPGRSGFRPKSRGSERFLRSPLSLLRGLTGWRFMEVPRKPIDRLSDGAIWIAVGAISRVLSRYILMAFPALSPVFTLLMLTPAMLAVFLVMFVPKTGWVPFYRLFLITLGLLVGGSFL